jgi:small subunit ribosomal protein S9
MPTKTKKTTTKRTKKVEQTPEKVLKQELKASESKKISTGTPSGKYYYANGKRKSSVARVRLYKGEGEITINGKPIGKFCQTKLLEETIKYPLKLTGALNRFNVTVLVTGGGVNSQAEAIRHGISKALSISDPLLRPTIKQQGLLTRDSRVKERKKFGLKRARRGPQFSKR